MRFEEFCLSLKERLAQPLPGAAAHEAFRAKPIGKMRFPLMPRQPPRRGGVIILLYEDSGIVRFPLIKRPDYPGAHGGQVSLPGGKAEPGENAEQTALRECEEEIGVPERTVEVLGRLTDYFVIPSNILVTPVVARVDHKPAFRPDPYEVSGVLEASLVDITNANSVKEREVVASGKYRMIAPHFEIENEVVWGATAMMLNELRVVLTRLR